MVLKHSRISENPFKASSEQILKQLPPHAKAWVESLSWQHRRYMLSLCHLMCAASPEMQAEFLDDYTADGLVAKKLADKETEQRVRDHLKDFGITTELNATVLRQYIRQFYIHTAQDARCQPDLYLESALRLVLSTEERSNVFNYILGFELLRMMFRMSWFQHEKLYRIQRNQEEFIVTYVKPIQYAHRVNGIIVPKDEGVFFAKRNYFVQRPELTEKKLLELVIATFTTDVATSFGFSIMRHPNALTFDYDYLFNSDSEMIFDLSMVE